MLNRNDVLSFKPMSSKGVPNTLIEYFAKKEKHNHTMNMDKTLQYLDGMNFEDKN
jgi:hypothetical protein